MREILEKIIFSSISKHTRFKLMEKANDAYFGEGIIIFQTKDALGVPRAPGGGFLDKPRQATF